MNKRESIAREIKRSLNTSHVRSIQVQLEKSVYLVDEMRFPAYSVSSISDLSPSKVFRALKTHRRNGTLRSTGLPMLLNKTQEMLLVSKIVDNYNNMNCLSYSDIIKEVFK